MEKMNYIASVTVWTSVIILRDSADSVHTHTCMLQNSEW